MIQEIAPHKFDLTYGQPKAQDEDFVLFIKKSKTLLRKTAEENHEIPKFSDFQEDKEALKENAYYLFAIDGNHYYYVTEMPEHVSDAYELCPTAAYRKMHPMYQAFAGITATQLHRFKESRKYCGCCGHLMENSKTERALVCPECGHVHEHGEHHHHDHDHECGCGHDHEEHEHHHHDHDHECGCGHDHEEHEHHHHDHDHECGCGHDHHDHHHHHADEVFTSWGRETIKKYTREGLEKMLEALSASEDYGIILRAKGMLPAEDGTWIYFDMVPEETEIREGAPEYTGRLCVIGSKLKEDKLAELFGLA